MDQTIKTFKDVNNGNQEYFASPKCYRNDKKELAERWVSTIEHDGIY